MERQKRKSLEERIADRQAQRPPIKEDKHFEHGPAKWLFVGVLVFIVLIHLVGLVIVMMTEI
ncbi:hypothetical protein HS048_22720 [Planomonospora sp. ID91781]|uniref:Uncharacterized protein n=1 Tax=Planomonospora sphaerica TaxID=161355 RepID=A0A171CUN0_9ACTN|nr:MULTISPECIES: hypothetical protein [Planomonospora]MBG0823544.1 hypothetical protein [Planomonospora sp. ID91781]GAT67247.1 hypothetical protein PS9374_02900 [Planomonospora sphaerica]